MNPRDLEARIHERTNEARRRRNLPSLAYDPDLRVIAQYHSQRMARAGRIFHEAPDGEGLSDRFKKHEYPLRSKAAGQRFCHGCGTDLRRFENPKHCPDCGVALTDRRQRSATSGENLAYQGYIGKIRSDPEIDDISRTVVEGWLDSPGHRENLLREAFDREGIGVAVQRGNGVEVFVTQHFS